MRITKKVFNDLAIWMIGFGVVVGIIFPFFILSFGVSREIAFSWKFITACIVAGAIVGTVNIVLSRVVVAKRLRLLTTSMQKVQAGLMRGLKGGDMSDCTPEKCQIKVDSNDEIGESAHAFNCLVDALSNSIASERALLGYTEMLTSNLELELLARKALSIILESTGSDAGAILVEKEGEIIPCETSGIKNYELLKNNGLIMEVLRTEKMKITKLPQDIVIDGLLVDFKPREIVIQPVIYNGIPIGAILLASAENYDHENINRIKMFSQSMALALHNAIIHEQMQKLATIDSLTGLINRRYGLVRLKEEFSRAVRSENSLGAIMFDIDHFKKINDTYGHISGDRVLAHIARLVKSILREGDVVLRYGGEEFCAVLPGASADDSFKTAERIRFAVQESEVLYSGYNIKVTLSLGVASYPEDNIQNELELIKFADEALYISKETGRNKSTVK